ncbi:glycosyltransferase family 2 protein [Dokdonia ponticola]|uniref:Glycosyltransferase family 2 protein n=1 Tax=Dokdonia ponticola TaxID=2041041 RepID=A0ABV9I2E3_9FLAO
MNIPLVSIIIPAYNASAYIEKTIASVLAQTYAHIEVILIDDGSTDGTRDFFSSFEAQGIQCYHIKNSGASHARNIGLEKAKGEYIQFLDADDLLHQNKISRQITRMQEEQALLCFSPWAKCKEEIDPNETYRFENLPYALTRSGKELMMSFALYNWFMPVFSWLTHRSLIDKAGVWNTTISNNDDGEFFSRILYHTEKVVCEDAILGYYRILEHTTLSTFNTVKKIDSAYKSYQLIEDFLSKDSDASLLSYPKRMYYLQYIMIRKTDPVYAKRAAASFDRIKADSFLRKNKLQWFFIQVLGLYNGNAIYELYLRIIKKIKKTFKKL